MTHDDDAVAHTGHNAHIVGNEGDARTGFAFQFVHQLQHLRLHGHIERSRRLVGQQELRIAEHGDRNHDALAHAAREFMRELVHPACGFRDSHILQPIDTDPVGSFPLQPFVKSEHFAHLRADGHVRRQAGQRILEDHGHPGTANFAQRSV